MAGEFTSDVTMGLLVYMIGYLLYIVGVRADQLVSAIHF